MKQEPRKARLLNCFRSAPRKSTCKWLQPLWKFAEQSYNFVWQTWADLHRWVRMDVLKMSASLSQRFCTSRPWSYGLHGSVWNQNSLWTEGFCWQPGRNAFTDCVMRCHSAEWALGDFVAAWKLWLAQNTEELSDDDQDDVIDAVPVESAWTCTAWEAQMPLPHR